MAGRRDDPRMRRGVRGNGTGSVRGIGKKTGQSQSIFPLHSHPHAHHTIPHQHPSHPHELHSFPHPHPHLHPTHLRPHPRHHHVHVHHHHHMGPGSGLGPSAQPPATGPPSRRAPRPNQLIPGSSLTPQLAWLSAVCSTSSTITPSPAHRQLALSRQLWQCTGPISCILSLDAYHACTSRNRSPPTKIIHVAPVKSCAS
jgi:hypothetical protein